MNCHCEAYPFPHRALGGRCEGAGIWGRTYDEGWECGECPHCEHRAQAHPCGEGRAVERWRECTAPSYADCPAVQAAACGRGAAA